MKQFSILMRNRNTWLNLAWLIAIGATLVSLSLQYVIGFIPCELCWYQRIFMYSLVFVLGVGVARRDEGVVWYALPLAASGAVIAAYHYGLQMFGSAGITCSSFVSCTTRYVEYFGFITIPFGSLISFAAIIGCLYVIRRLSRRK